MNINPIRGTTPKGKLSKSKKKSKFSVLSDSEATSIANDNLIEPVKRDLNRSGGRGKQCASNLLKEIDEELQK